MKKLLIFVFAVSASVTVFADGPEEAMQRAHYICDQMDGREAKVASPSRGEKPDFYVDYNTQSTRGENNIGSQRTNGERVGYNNTYGEETRTGGRKDENNSRSTTVSGSIPIRCE